MLNHYFVLWKRIQYCISTILLKNCMKTKRTNTIIKYLLCSGTRVAKKKQIFLFEILQNFSKFLSFSFLFRHSVIMQYGDLSVYAYLYSPLDEWIRERIDAHISVPIHRHIVYTQLMLFQYFNELTNTF